MMHLTHSEELSFRQILKAYIEDEKVCQMKTYVQHGSVSTYAHCLRVARASYWLNRRLHLGSDEHSLLIGAMLHDFYLYDWHDGKPCRKIHGFTHPEFARQNAVRYFHIGPKAQLVIRSHMWPMTLLHVPSCREAIIVCIMDKYCSAVETLLHRGKKGEKNVN